MLVSRAANHNTQEEEKVYTRKSLERFQGDSVEISLNDLTTVEGNLEVAEKGQLILIKMDGDEIVTHRWIIAYESISNIRLRDPH